MKKIITLLALSITLFSCNKDEDEGEKQLPVTYENIVGRWNYTQVVNIDGSLSPFVGFCPTKTDYLDIFINRRIITYNYYGNCVDTGDEGGSSGFYIEGNRIYNGNTLFDNCTVTYLTANRMRVDFDEEESLSYLTSPATNIKGVIYTR